MKTITLTDKQFDTLFEYLDGKVESIVNTSVDYQDSELLEDFEDLFEVHDILAVSYTHLTLPTILLV